LAFASNLGDAYAMASPQVRRNLNQSMGGAVGLVDSFFP
jgi:hypothetical protein